MQWLKWHESSTLSVPTKFFEGLADVAELEDAPDSRPGVYGHAGSIPAIGTRVRGVGRVV